MDRMFKALADPTRRKIVEMLKDGDRTAGEIAAEFPVAWASISHHLTVLRNADLIVSERDGQFIRYSLNTTVFQEVVSHLMDLIGSKRKERRRA